ncbi:hypothetical protein [Alcanivorax sp.]|jgi:hypothetical protein|uniref:hypothetical protein n=1 Tax=Alcanivorax sp. TaxID=1872427 RepID=UPI0032D8DCC0
MLKKSTIAFVVAVFITATAYFSRDFWVANAIEEMLQHQANVKINHDLSVSGVELDSKQGLISLQSPSLMARDDPDHMVSMRAGRIDFDAAISGVFSPHVKVSRAQIYDAEFVIDYIAPGVSNLKLMEETFRNYINRRREEGGGRLFEWDVDNIDLYQVDFTLVDYDGKVLANVKIPEIHVSTLSTKNSGKENLSIVISELQKSVLIETLKGRVTGSYDTKGLLLLARREFPQFKLIKNDPLTKFNKMRDDFLDKWIQK